MTDKTKAKILILLDNAFLKARQQIIHILEKNALETKNEPLDLNNKINGLSKKILELLLKELNGKDN